MRWVLLHVRIEGLVRVGELDVAPEELVTIPVEVELIKAYEHVVYLRVRCAQEVDAD